MTLDSVFVVCAVGGGALFVVQLALQLFGFAGVNLDIDPDVHVGDGHPSADASFKVLSLQSLTSFFLMFGLLGLATLRSQENPSFGHSALSALVGLAGGVVTTWGIAKLFRVASRLQSSGTLDFKRLLNATGSVYLTIKTDKPGKVTIVAAGRQLTLDARLASGEDATLETGAPIIVTRVLEDETLEVRRN
jgi:hypothetical protein